MITLREAIEKSKISMSRVADAIGVSASQMSLVCSHTYNGWGTKEKELIEKMVSAQLITKGDSDLEVPIKTTELLHVDPNKFIITQNVMAIDTLAKDLLDPATTLNASIGVVYGRAGYGKTTAIRHFCATNDRAIYTLFIEGFTLNMLMKTIVKEFRSSPCGTFGKNLEEIRSATTVYRRLICIDEADRMPLKFLESIRGINEECGVPVMLVGEYTLQAKMASLPRLESRIRSTPVEFAPLSLFDVGTFWQEAVGIDLTGKDIIKAQLLKRSHGDFRIMVNDAHRIVSVMNANGMHELNKEVLDAVK